MMTTDPTAEKRRLRRAMRDPFRSVTLERARSAGAVIAERLARLPYWRLAARVVIFVSRVDEIDTGFVWSRASDDGKTVLLPRLVDGGILEFAAAEKAGLVSNGRYGIPEPPLDSPAQALFQGDLILVPGVAFDRQGGRLGRGGGYYDRTFARGRFGGARPILIGVGFSFQVVARVPMTTLDVRMDAILSEDDIVLVGEADREDPK